MQCDPPAGRCGPPLALKVTTRRGAKVYVKQGQIQLELSSVSLLIDWRKFMTERTESELKEKLEYALQLFFDDVLEKKTCGIFSLVWT